MVGYFVSLAIFTATFALFSLGLNLQWGYTGLINFGHVAFMTVGAYTTALLSLNGVPLPLAVVAGVTLAALLGLLIGLSTVRLREDYLAIVTIGVAEVVRLVALNEAWLTRGTRGVYNYPLPLDFNPNLFSKLGMIGLLSVVAGLSGWQLLQWLGQRFQQRQLRDLTFWLTSGLGLLGLGLGAVVYICGVIALYNYTFKAGLMLLLLVCLAVVFWQLQRWAHSPWGRVLKAIREDEEVPKALGKHVFWYKLQALMLGGAIAGLAGAFYAWQLTYFNPDGFIPLVTFTAWIIVVLGGAGNNVGTILGAVIFWAYQAVTRFVLPAIAAQLAAIVPPGNSPIARLVSALDDDARISAFRIMIIGLILILLMMWRPQGILGKKEELTLGR